MLSGAPTHDPFREGCMPAHKHDGRSMLGSVKSRLAVYFIRCGEDGPIKIGQTNKPIPERLISLQVGCPYPLRVLAIISKCPRALERRLHERFGHCRIRGEWFGATDELLAYIATFATPYGSGRPELADLKLYESTKDDLAVPPRVPECRLPKGLDRVKSLAFARLASLGASALEIRGELGLGERQYFRYLRHYRDSARAAR